MERVGKWRKKIEENATIVLYNYLLLLPYSLQLRVDGMLSCLISSFDDAFLII